MARIRDFAVTEQGGSTSTSIVCNMPVHEAGDALIHFSSKDGAVAITATSGWLNIQDGLTAGCAYRSECKAAASAEETLTLATGTAENWTVVVVSIDGADASSLANLIANSGAGTAKSGADDTAMPFTGPSSSTNADTNCLVMHAWFSDSGLSPTAYAPLVNIYAGDNGANSVGVAYTYQRAAGAVAARDWFGRVNDDGRGIVLAIKDSSSDAKVARYSDPAISSGQVLRPMVGLATTFSDTWPASLTVPAIGDDFDYVQKDVSGAFTDYTTAANDATAGDVVFGGTSGNLMYFGGNEKFQGLVINISTASTIGTGVWEYWNGSAWATITGMLTANNNLSATGWVLITLTSAAVGLMASTTINSQDKFWIRHRCTANYTVAPVATQARKGGRTAAYIVSTASGDNGTNPYTDGAGSAGSSTTTTLGGFEWAFGSALDMDTGIIYSTERFALRRDGDVDPSFPMPVSNPGGIQWTFLDSSNNYASYMVHARGAKDINVDGRSVFAIDWNGSAIPWAVRGSVNKSAITRVICTSLGAAGAVAVVYSMLSLVTRIGIAGGSSTYPMSFDDVEYVASACVGIFPFIQRSGAAATVYAPLQFGGGDRVCLEVDKITLQFPQVYDGVKYVAWNAAANVAGVKFYPKSGDVIKFTGCLFTSPSPYRWEFDASMASSGWTMDFSGTTVVGATVTLQSASDLDAVTFIDCPTFTQNGATLTNCSFQGTKVSSSSPANAALISDSSFASAGTGHGIEISGTAADISLDGLQFTGYAGSNGSTGNEAIYVNIASGTMTISIVGGGSTPSIRTAGATVTVQNAVTLTITVYDAATGDPIENARVLLEKVSDGADVLTGLTNASGVATTTFAYVSDTDVIGTVRRASAGYGTLYKPGAISGTITAAGFSATVLMTSDE